MVISSQFLNCQFYRTLNIFVAIDAYQHKFFFHFLSLSLFVCLDSEWNSSNSENQKLDKQKHRHTRAGAQACRDFNPYRSFSSQKKILEKDRLVVRKAPDRPPEVGAFVYGSLYKKHYSQITKWSDAAIRGIYKSYKRICTVKICGPSKRNGCSNTVFIRHQSEPLQVIGKVISQKLKR